MRIAFYAPMKPPDDPKPSGDRQIARLLISALERSDHEVALASRFRSWMREPEAAAFEDMAAQARKEADRVAGALTANGARPDLWLTYHLYHRAPDWIGPLVADALKIPYVVIEASRALKRSRDAWAPGFEAADAALTRADVVIALHEDDAEGLASVVAEDRLYRLRPFIDTKPFSAAAQQHPDNEMPVLVTVAMMREGDKARSYALLADAMKRLTCSDWRHIIVGDGPARQRIAPLFDPARTEFFGAVSSDALPDIYRRGDLFVWPAIREAFGMVFIEAQAAGLAVLAGRAGGVGEIVQDGETGVLVPTGDTDAFAAALDRLLMAPDTIRQMAEKASRYAVSHHDIETARHVLEMILNQAVRKYAARSVKS